MLVDTHCHLHDKKYFLESREEVYQLAVEADVKMIVVGTSEQDSRSAVEFAVSHENAWAAIGVHPHDVKNGWQDIRGILGKSPNKLVAIGEIGLDYFYEHSPRLLQIQSLEEQLQWACDYELPVSFHVREAFDDFWPIFDNFHGLRGVLHSFTDSKVNLEKGLSRGLYIGVNGISTFTKDVAQKEMYAVIPLNKLLLETDAPYLTPKPFRGKVNEPAYVRDVARHQADIRNVSFDEIAARSTANAHALFAI